MAVTGEEKIRGLIRLIPSTRALKQDLEKNLHMDLYSGSGEMAVRSYSGIRESIASLTDDPYVEALALIVDPKLTEKEKVSLVVFMAGQLVAYLEGQTGLIGMGGENNVSIQTAPNFQGSSNNVIGTLPKSDAEEDDEV